MEISEIRRLNLQRLVTAYLSQVAFAKVIARSPDQVGHLLSGRRNLGPRLANHIESACQLTSGSLSRLPIDQVGQYNPAAQIDYNKELLQSLTIKPLRPGDAAIVLQIVQRLTI